jgi:hypothetical protein
MQAPDITYEFHVQGAHAHWSIHSDGVHITEATSESGVHVTGVNADAMFSMCRNAIACNREYSVFHELSNKPHQLACIGMVGLFASAITWQRANRITSKYYGKR